MHLVLNVNIKYVYKRYLYLKNVCTEVYFFHASNNAIIYMFFTLICIYHSIPISFSYFFFQISLGTSFTIQYMYFFYLLLFPLPLFRSKLRPLLVVFSWLEDTKISFDWTCAWKESTNIFEVKLFRTELSFPLPHTHIYNAAQFFPSEKIQATKGWRRRGMKRSEERLLLYCTVGYVLSWSASKISTDVLYTNKE